MHSILFDILGYSAKPLENSIDLLDKKLSVYVIDRNQTLNYRQKLSHEICIAP